MKRIMPKLLLLSLILALGAPALRAACTSFSGAGTIEQTWDAEVDGTVTSPMTTSTSGTDHVRANNNGTPTGSCALGCATYSFTPCYTGNYKLEMNIRAQDTNEDRLWVGIRQGGTGISDCYPNGGTWGKSWRIATDSNYQWRYVTDDNSSNTAGNARVWPLTAGTSYTIYMESQEDGVRIDQLRIRRENASCGAVPTPTRTWTRTPTFTPVPPVSTSCGVEAELGAEPSNFTEASGGGRTYIYATSSNTACCSDFKDIPIPVTATGEYRLQAWARPGSGSEDSYFIELRNSANTATINDTAGYGIDTWDLTPPVQHPAGYGNWGLDTVWGRQGGGSATAERSWNLCVTGTYHIRVYRRELNAYLDCFSLLWVAGCMTPTPTPISTPTPVPTVWQGLEASERLYDMEYIPLPPVSSGGTNFYDLSMTFTSAAANAVPKNTARWRIVLDASIAGLGSQIQVGARIRPYGVTCTTGYLDDPNWTGGGALPLPPRPANGSTTYFWLNAAKVPHTERYDTMGDPRYVPYRDMLGIPAGQAFANNYNWFFKDLGDTTHPDNLRASDNAPAYTALLPSADFHRYNGQPNTDVPKQFRLWREAIVRSRSVYTSMTGYNSYYIGVGGEIGGDSANQLTGGVPMSSQPWGAGGTGDRDEITGSAPLIRNTGNTWRSLTFLGELWPDSAYATDWASTGGPAAWGNLRNSGGGGGSWRRDGWENCDTANYTFNQVLHRTQEPGCATFLNGNGGSNTFNHYFETLNANLATDGAATSLAYHFPIPATFNVNRPWGLNAGGNTPPEWSLAPYPATRLTLDVYSASTQSANATGFYLRNSVTNATDRSSAAIRALDSATAATSPDTALGWFVVNGLAPSTQTGINFVAEFAMLTCLRTFHDAGAPTAAAGGFSNLKNRIGTNTYRIDPVPMVEILKPDLTTDTRNLAVIPIVYNERYARWDGQRYSENYPCLDVAGDPAQDGDGSRHLNTGAYCADSDANNPPNPALEWHGTEPLAYNLKYSEDNGATWFTATTPSISATAGVMVEDLPHKLTASASQRTFTWNWNVGSLSVGNKKFRVEVYRQNLKQHYAYHEMPIFTNP